MVTFITGNQKKADYLAKYLGYPVTHQKVDLDELQTLDLHKIVEHKLRQAFGIVQAPVLVEDVSLEFSAMGRLPGPFIRYFVDEMSNADICKLLDGHDDRSATARCTFGYYDGKTLQLFNGSMRGKITTNPTEDRSFGWDNIFIPEGHNVVRAELSEADDQKTYLQIKPFAAVKQFLKSIET